MINITDLSFQYKSSIIFTGFNWQVQRGESWAVLGPSGCGKSTLLGLLAGLRHPQEGKIQINDIIITRPRPQTGLILQDYGLLPWATVIQNASLGMQVRNYYGADGIHAPLSPQEPVNIMDWLERLGLSAVINKYPGQLSGGQRQRTAIARTLVLNPDLLLMDEPFSSLDAPTRESLQQLTLDLITERDLTLILVTHSIEEAAFLGKKILLLKEPPNRDPQVFLNPNAGTLRYRESDEYQALCKSLRNSMKFSFDD